VEARHEAAADEADPEPPAHTARPPSTLNSGPLYRAGRE
jgi:hypothetical protein